MQKKGQPKVPGSGKKKGSVTAPTLSEADYTAWAKVAIELSLKGTTDWNIKKVLADGGLSAAQSKKVRDIADNYVLKNYSKDIQKSVERSISQYQELYNLAISMGDIRSALKARERIDKIVGLEVQKIQTIDANSIPTTITLTEIITDESEDNESI